MAEPTPGQIIRELMVEKGVTQQELSRRAGCTPTAISNILEGGGEGMTLLMYRRLCAGLGVSAAATIEKLPPLEPVATTPIPGRGRPKGSKNKSRKITFHD